MERVRAEAALRESERRQTFLLRFGDTLRSITNEMGILQTAARLLGEHLDVDRSFFGELFPERGIAVLHPDYARGDLPSLAGEFKLSDFQETVDAMQAGLPFVIPDVARSELLSAHTREAYRVIGYASFFSVPLFKHGTLVTILSAVASQPRHWTAREIQLTQEVAERTWTLVERARAEEVLRESEARFRFLVEPSAQAVWETDPDGVMVADSPSWRAYTGQSCEESKGYGWMSSIHPDDREPAERLWREAVAARQNVNAELRVLDAKGGWRWTNLRAAPLLGPDGTVARWVGMCLDVHDRRTAGREG
jgi:PAS domain S-box-containing protein